MRKIFKMTGIEAEILSRRLALHLRKGHFEGCRIILEEAERVSIETKKSRKALAELELPLRLVNALEEAGYIYVNELEGVDFDELRVSSVNLGPKLTQLLKEKVEEALGKRDAGREEI